jgi:TRAP-type transport system small permease protein
MPQDSDPAEHGKSHKLSRMISPVAHGCRYIAAAALIALMLITVGDVIARSCFGLSSDSSEEYGGYLLVVITFISVPVAAAHSGFHQVELVRKRLGAGPRLLLQTLFTVASLAICVIVTWNLANFEIFSFRSGDVSQTSLQTPLWIPQLAMPLGFTLFCWVLLNQLIGQLALLVRNFHPPRGEPSI